MIQRFLNSRLRQSSKITFSNIAGAYLYKVVPKNALNNLNSPKADKIRNRACSKEYAVLSTTTQQKNARLDTIHRNISLIHQETNDLIGVPIVNWFPQTIDDLNISQPTLMEFTKQSNQERPQFTDKQYRKRREDICRISQAHLIGQPVPIIDYTLEENQTWVELYTLLRGRLQNVMSSRYLKNLKAVEEQLHFKKQIPQLRDIDQYLQEKTGFRIKTCGGMINQREFLNALAHKVFYCGQFIRHPADIRYAPEPDVVHEIIGHVPMLADQDLAKISQQIGIQSCGCDDETLSKLGNLYFQTIEFGSHLEDGKLKAYGAGIAGSIGEIDHYTKSEFEKLDPNIHSKTIGLVQDYQPKYVYTNTLEETFDLILSFSHQVNKPFKLKYNDSMQKIISDRPIQFKE